MGINDGGRGRAAWLVGGIMVLSACAVTARLDDRFDPDPLGGAPSVSPPPNPPADSVSVTTLQQVTSVIVPAPGGGRWLRVTPNAAFVASPDLRKRSMTVTTDTFATSPPANIRGNLRMRLDGIGMVTVGFQPVQPRGATAPIIGGFVLGAFSAGVAGQANIVRGFSVARMDDIFPLPSAGLMRNYQPGTVIDINWNIDQAGRTFNANAAGGSAQSVSFDAVSGGVATTPIAQLTIWFWLEKVSGGTAVFIDNLYAEEYR